MQPRASVQLPAVMVRIVLHLAEQNDAPLRQLCEHAVGGHGLAATSPCRSMNTEQTAPLLNAGPSLSDID